MSIDIRTDIDGFLAGEPGLYAGIDNETYQSFDACSNSRLTTIHEGNEAKLAYKIQKKTEEEGEELTEAKQFGQWAHACILEPELFDRKFDKARQCNGAKKDGSRCTNSGKIRITDKWYCGTHQSQAPPGEPDAVQAIPDKKFDQLIEMRKACREHPMIGRILELPSYRELSGLWIDEATGLLCKMRIDLLCYEHSLIVDYKTTGSSVRDEDVSWAIWKRAYYRQSPFYLSGCKALGLPVDDFAFIFQEKAGPYPARVFRIDEPSMSVGVVQLRELMKRYRAAKETGIWPGYDDGANITPIGLPDRIMQYEISDGERSAISTGEITL